MVILKMVRETTRICSVLLLLDLIWKTDGLVGIQRRNQSNHKSDQLQKTIEQRANEAAAPSTECLPVPEKILWQKLASDLSSFTRGRIALTASVVPKRRPLRPKIHRNEKNKTQKTARRGRGRKLNRHVNEDFEGKFNQCEFQRRWKRMPDGVFPPFIETGRCSRKPCMTNLYLCVPRKYAIKVLKRVPNKCRPNGINLTNAEVWQFSEHDVTVGCSCEKRKRIGVYPSTFATELLQKTI